MPKVIFDAFERFPKEASIIGSLLAAYSTLEIDLMYCVVQIRNDMDTVLKAMFRARGELQRIRIADAFGRLYYNEHGLGAEFERAIGAMNYCRKIRNQYAHCNWWDDNTGRLAFAKLEEVADLNIPVTNLDDLTTLHIDVPTLESQANYFSYTERLLVWLNFEGRRRTGRLSSPSTPEPKQIEQPPLRAPQQ